MTEGNQRPDWDEYFLDIAALVARRSTCLRRNVGAVLVRERRILSTGYNGAQQVCAIVWISAVSGFSSKSRQESGMNFVVGFMPNRMRSFRRPFMVLVLPARRCTVPISPVESAQK